MVVEFRFIDRLICGRWRRQVLTGIRRVIMFSMREKIITRVHVNRHEHAHTLCSLKNTNTWTNALKQSVLCGPSISASTGN